MTSRAATMVAVAALLLTSCGDSTPSDEAELRSILDTVADRAGMSAGPCYEECVSKALAAFDECVRQGGDRERCFGQAIHHFYRCMDECAPPTCEERCEVRARRVFEECVALGGDPDRCAQQAREALTRCLKECDRPEPPTCEERCQARAEQVFQACVEQLGDEDRCRAHAQEFLVSCLDECERPPVCRSDEDCDRGESCQLEVCINTCLDNDPVCIDSCIGVCVPDVCICPAVYDPVCGVDGVTYGNACEARCAGVEIAHEGECRDECQDNGDCPDDLVCFPPSKTCQPRCVVDCLVCDPVCGEDGVTYCCGETDAHCNGVEVAHPGSCECEPVLCDLFCEFGFKLGPDGCPICECNEPCICTEEYDPVCGVDGVTYSNACFARCAGVEVAHEGECLPECESNADCAKALICYPPSKTCQPQCEIACFRYDPVCGTDGVTYGCGEQDAWCHGVEVAYEGECRCFGDQDCPDGTRCNAADICLPPPGCELGDVCPAVCTGFCVPDKCICPAIYAPVCGIDGVTYGNSCEAACAGVEIAHEGVCGLCAELGVPREICPIVLCAPEGGDPVCGIDGMTYPNACMACCGAGMEIEHVGECRG